MNIRSITYFLDPGYPLDETQLKKTEAFVAQARPAFEAAGYVVQTARLATTPFPHFLPDLTPEALINFAQTFEQIATSIGCEYVALGPALPDYPESYSLIPKVLAETENTFFSAVMASVEAGISLPAVRACAEIIHQATTLDPNGFSNLYFAALANVPAGSPFFPAAYHAADEPRFALALESADLAVTAFTQASSLAEARQNLIDRIESHAQVLTPIAEELSEQFDLPFGGLDFSLAPFPEEAQSLGTALERLGLGAVGFHGSLAGAAFITDTLDKARYQRTGFNGLMLPLLEDSTLAKRATQGMLTLKDLLMYSAVCGTGLDTVPLPGDTPPEILATVLLDLAALGQRLAKPLTARLMPIPGKQAGEPTEFDFPFFANCHILKVEAEPLQGMLAGSEQFHLGPR